nr:DUF3265 domain-containing protein [Vibrio sp. SCSIO 43153]
MKLINCLRVTRNERHFHNTPGCVFKVVWLGFVAALRTT